MNIKILAVGKLKKGYINEGVCDFCKRLSKFSKIEIIEVKDEKTPDKMSETEAALIREKEGARLLAHIDEKSYVVCLDIQGRTLTSEQLAAFLAEQKLARVKTLIFVIGGSIGLSPEVLRRADWKLSFSKMTFPHGLMRLILLEQLYRAEKILAGEPYHK